MDDPQHRTNRRPIDVTARRMEVRYTADWKPVEFSIDATVRGQPQTIHTTFDGTTAKNDITIAGQTTTKSDPIEPGAIILPNALFAPYEALAARLRTAAPDSTFPVYILPQASLTLRVVDSVTEQIQTAARLIVARRTHVTISTPNAPLDINIWGDENGRLLRLTVPAQNIDVAREDIASVAARQVTISRPNDELVRIPSNGFSLAGTLSKPAAGLHDAATRRDSDRRLRAGRSRWARVWHPDPGRARRSAGRRGVHRAALRQTRHRPERRPPRSGVAGGLLRRSARRREVPVSDARTSIRSESPWSATARAAWCRCSPRPKRNALPPSSSSPPGTSGAELVLAQQQHALSRSNLPEAEKQTRIDLQKRINEAAMTGKGLDALSPDIRRQIDNAEFQSLLTTDPAKIIPDVRQPILIVQGELDTQVAPANADRLEALARARKATGAGGRRQGSRRQPPAGSRRHDGRGGRVRHAAGQAHQPGRLDRCRGVAEEDPLK